MLTGAGVECFDQRLNQMFLGEFCEEPFRCWVWVKHDFLKQPGFGRQIESKF